MTWWLVIGAILIAFLVGGMAVAEMLCRREKARQGMPWSDNSPTGPDKLSSD